MPDSAHHTFSIYEERDSHSFSCMWKTVTDCFTIWAWSLIDSGGGRRGKRSTFPAHAGGEERYKFIPFFDLPHFLRATNDVEKKNIEIDSFLSVIDKPKNLSPRWCILLLFYILITYSFNNCAV